MSQKDTLRLSADRRSSRSAPEKAPEKAQPEKAQPEKAQPSFSMISSGTE